MFDLLFSSNLHSPLAILLTMIAGYLAGSVPFGLLLTKFAGMGDIRAIGSGNIGATNVLRTGSKKLAAATLLLDMLKGLIPVVIARHIHGDLGALMALACLLGHLFPVWLSFKGGKGVATGIGVLLGLWWPLGLGVICLWLLTAMVFRYSSLAALAAFGFAPVLAMLLSHQYQLTFVTLITSAIIWARHHENIVRLAKGQESKINLGGKK